MLSEIWGKMWDFECANGVRPNVLYINNEHLKLLLEDFYNEVAIERIIKILGVRLVINRDICHPHVSWQAKAANGAE